MANSNHQQSLVQAMLEPAFYPKPPQRVTHKETHISHLFFAGELVYKIKKSVRYSFLDYSTLAKRRYFLQEELRLNRRLAPSVYIGVMPISFDDAGWRLGGWAEPAEYTLVMRRLPDKRMLPFLLETGQVTSLMMCELAEFLAEFHRESERVTGIAPLHYATVVEKQWNENLADLEPFVGELFDRENFNAIKKFASDFIKQHSELLERRAEQGWIRDVHGDLHTEHICFAPEGIQIFDCIEFNPQFRQCDLASEIAFLTMDIEARGGADLAMVFLTRYSELLNDTEAMKLLPFWKCYRALVRAKVYALRGQNGCATAARYFRYAARLTWQPLEPFLLMVTGLTGSGKSLLAGELSERTGAVTINSDIVRKSIAAKSGRHYLPYGEGIYSATMTAKTYTKMAREAERLLVQDRGVILDATFVRRARREPIVRLAKKHQVPLFVIHCSAPEELTQARLVRREAVGESVSDGRWEIYLQQKEAFEPMDEIDSAARLELNTDAPLEALVSASEKFLRARLGGSDI